LPFPQALPDTAIHHNHRFIEGYGSRDFGAGGVSADTSIVGRVSAGVDGATANTARRLMFPTTLVD
jgi:hypothetical protein